MPTVLAQSNLPKSAAVVVSSETIILRDPNNNLLEKYTSDEQRQKAFNSYGVKPSSLLSPGANKTDPSYNPYKFFDWLADDDNAFIITNILPKANYKYEIEFLYESGNPNYMFGVLSKDATDNSKYTRFTTTVVPRPNNLIDLHVYLSFSSDGYTTISNLPQEKTKMRIEGGKIYINDVEKATISNYNESLAATQELYIFAENYDSVSRPQGVAKIFSFKIYDENDEPLLNLMPATKNGVPGFYDSVSDTFLVNASESGSLIVGNGETPAASLLGASLGTPTSNPDEKE